MKKRILPLFLILGAAALGVSTSVIKNYTPAVYETKADEKETVYFNVTSKGAYNDNLIILNVDKQLPAGTKTKTSVFYNGSYTDFWINYGTESSIYFTWSGHVPHKTNSYSHFRIDAGTVFYEDASIRYVFENDYNIWWTAQSGGNGNYSMIAQENVPSFKISAYNTQNVMANGFWQLFVQFEKKAEAKSLGFYNGTPYYEADGRDEYTLYDWSSDPFACMHGDNSGVLNTDATEGQIWLRIPFKNHTDSASGTDNKCRSIWFPKGTLFGGWVSGYPMYLENDVYFDHDGQWFSHAVYSTSTKERVYDPLDAFRTSLKMDDATFDGNGTGACKTLYPNIKSTWNGFTTYQKKAFANTDYYAPAFERLQAWATANGDVLNPTSYALNANNTAILPIFNNNQYNNRTIEIAIVSVVLVASIGIIGLFILIKRKRYNK